MVVSAQSNNLSSCQTIESSDTYLLRKLSGFFNYNISNAAALVAGAVNLIYQYLAEGYYPTGKYFLT